MGTTAIEQLNARPPAAAAALRLASTASWMCCTRIEAYGAIVKPGREDRYRMSVGVVALVASYATHRGRREDSVISWISQGTGVTKNPGRSLAF